MATNTLTTRNSGETITTDSVNDFKSALSGDFVGRNASGVPTAAQALGTIAFPWGTVRAGSLVLNGSVVDTSQITAPPNRVISGAKRSTSNQPAYIIPNGASLSLVVDGTPTELVVDINGTEVTVNTDITKSSLTAAPASNNTALVNDTEAADQHDTRLWGEPEHRKTITMDTVGSNISALVGKWAAFKINNGADDEYFLAFVKSATELAYCRRGYFYDASKVPMNRIVFSNNDTITLMKLGFVFVENDGTTVDVTYVAPTYSTEAPSGPATGDYWYDLANQVWKRYDGAQFNIINRTLIGVFCNDTTACVGARSIDFYAKADDLNMLSIEKNSTEIARADKPNCVVSVAGRVIDYGNTLASWNITTDLAGSEDMYDSAEQNSRMYYLYVKDTGETIISDISPYFLGAGAGEYHPHNPWRCVGLAYNNDSGDLQGAGSVGVLNDEIILKDGNGFGSTSTFIRRFSNAFNMRGASIYWTDSATQGSRFVCAWPGRYAVNYIDSWGATSSTGVSLNTVNPATGILSITNALEVLQIGISVSNYTSISTQAQLKIGDTIAAHAGSVSVSDGTAVDNVMRITKLG